MGIYDRKIEILDFAKTILLVIKAGNSLNIYFVIEISRYAKIDKESFVISRLTPISPYTFCQLVRAQLEIFWSRVSFCYSLHLLAIYS